MEPSKLTIDQVYVGGRAGNAGDDPFPALLGLSNQGGFRYLGRRDQPDLLVLLTSMSDANWPDSLDRETGILTYYGDNKRPGLGLHETPRYGNLILRDLFQRAQTAAGRALIPPILVFARTAVYRDVIFLGLAVPGTANGHATDDLVAVWRSEAGKRFQNYRARFSILNVDTVRRQDLNNWKSSAPTPWRNWVTSGQPAALTATPNHFHRKKSEQIATDDLTALVDTIYQYFQHAPHDFEYCAAQLCRWNLKTVTELTVTRPSRDGGRDAIGLLQVGSTSSIAIDFALEAKCYSRSNGVGVKELSRLISRLRHRQFGVLVTTSYLDLQAYREVVEDGHPIIVISHRDIARLLIERDLTTPGEVQAWLIASFPRTP